MQLCSMPFDLVKSANSLLVNWGPLSVPIFCGIPWVAKKVITWNEHLPGLRTYDPGKALHNPDALVTTDLLAIPIGTGVQLLV